MLVLGVLPTVAYAARGPTPQERRALLEMEPRLQQIVVSTKGPYARGYEPGGRSGVVQPGEQLFVNDHAHWRWLVALPSEGIPCSVPAAVVSDLNLRRYGYRPPGCESAASVTPLRWLAAGDSYSSGEGLPHSTGPCAQANPGSGSRAWTQAAYQDLGPDKSGFQVPTLAACTGAQSWRFFEPGTSIVHVFHQRTLPAEWSRAMGRFGLVTFTFGGDDLDFGGVVKQCIGLPFAAKYPSDPGHRCPKDSLLRTNIASFGKGFAQLLRTIATDAVTTGGRILVLGYPELIEAPSLWPQKNRQLGHCADLAGTLGLRSADAYEIRGLAGDLNATIGRDVAAVNPEHPNQVQLAFVDVNSGGSVGIARDDPHLFEPSRGVRHNLCSQAPWLNGVTTIDGGNGSFHPNQAGENAMGALAAAALVHLHWTQQPLSLLIRGGDSFAGVPNPATLAQVIARFGQPSTMRGDGSGVDCYATWLSPGITALFQDFGATSAQPLCQPAASFNLSDILLTGGRWITDRGVGIGAPLAALVNSYPEAQGPADCTTDDIFGSSNRWRLFRIADQNVMDSYICTLAAFTDSGKISAFEMSNQGASE